MAGSRRVAVFGLDGVPYTQLTRLIDAGVMPRIAEIVRKGGLTPMTSVQPPVSSVAWTSFMTGSNPGRHGIFGFTDLQPGRRAVRLPSFDDIAAPVLWTRYPERRFIVVNLPFTYPARPLNGVLIAGFVVPDFDKSVYPRSLIPRLRARGYRTDVDAAKGRNDRPGLMKDLFETPALREEIGLALMRDEPWDAFIFVVTGTDRLNHFFYDAVFDPSHPFHQDTHDYFRAVDACLGRLFDALPPGIRIILLSDHGFTALKTQVYLNHLLRNLGYLHYTTPNPKTVADIHPASKAFAMDPSRIYLNTADRFSDGAVSPNQVHTIRSQLRVALESVRLRDVGLWEPPEGDKPDDAIFDAVLPREDVYEGPRFAAAPDLIVIPRRGYDLKAGVDVNRPTMRDIFTGTHTHDDAFLAVNDPNAGGRTSTPNITDAAGLIEEALR